MSTSARRKINKTRSRSVLQLYKIFKDFSSSWPIPSSHSLFPSTPSLYLFLYFSLPYNTIHKNNLNLCKDRLVKHTKQQSGHHVEVYLVLPDHWSVATRYRTTDESHTDVLWGVCPHGWVVAIDYPVFYTPPFRDFCCCHRWRESSWGWNQEKILQLQHKRWRSTAI